MIIDQTNTRGNQAGSNTFLTNKGAEHEACWFYQQNKQSGQLLQWKICGGQGSGKYSIVYIKTFLEQVVGPNAHGSVDWAWKWAGLFGEADVKVFWEGKSFLLKEVSHCPFFNFFIYLTYLWGSSYHCASRWKTYYSIDLGTADVILPILEIKHNLNWATINYLL